MQEFKDVEFMSAKDKKILLRQWKTFIKNGMKWEHFKDRIYQHLHLHCSFIAHYTRLGFYCVYFENAKDTLKFLEQFDPIGEHISVEYGSTHWFADPNYADINIAMCEALRPHLTEIRKKLSKDEYDQDLASIQPVLQKWNLVAIDRKMMEQSQ